MESRSSWYVWLALIVIQLGFGAYGVVVAKFAVKNKADPLVFSLIRDAGAFPVLLMAAIISEKRLQVPDLRDLPMFAILGLTGMFGNQLLFILGVYYTNANIASIFQPAIPVWTAFLAIITRVEAFPPLRKVKGWAKIIGILLAAGGAATMVIDKVKSDGKLPVGYGLGYLFLAGNTLSMSVYVLLQKKLIFDKEDCAWKTMPISVTAWSYLFGAIFMSLASLYYVNKPEKFTYIPSEEIYPIIYAIFIASSLCYLLITWCNMQISASIVTATWPLQVLFCAVLAYFVLGESLATLEYIGAVLIVLGLFAVVWSNYKQDEDRGKEEAHSFGYVRVGNTGVQNFGAESPPKTHKVN